MGLLVDLRYEATQDAVGLFLVMGRLGQVVPVASDRIDAGVHQHLIRTATLPDMSALAALGPGPLTHNPENN